MPSPWLRQYSAFERHIWNKRWPVFHVASGSSRRAAGPQQQLWWTANTFTHKDAVLVWCGGVFVFRGSTSHTSPRHVASLCNETTHRPPPMALRKRPTWPAFHGTEPHSKRSIDAFAPLTEALIEPLSQRGWFWPVTWAARNPTMRPQRHEYPRYIHRPSQCRVAV